MPADEVPPDYVLRVPLIPLSMAHELTALLVEIRNRCRALECAELEAGRSPEELAHSDLGLAAKLLLAELDQYLWLAQQKGLQVTEDRWDRMLEDLRTLRSRLAAQQ